jgi:hypothetical protein
MKTILTFAMLLAAGCGGRSALAPDAGGARGGMAGAAAGSNGAAGTDGGAGSGQGSGGASAGSAGLDASAGNSGGRGGGSANGDDAGGARGCALDDVNEIFTTMGANVTTGCTVIGACHDNAGSAAGLDLSSAGWQTKLIGREPSPTAGASGAMSVCAGQNLVYLEAGSNPAAGLFIDKLRPGATAPCGTHMPNLGAELSPRDFACVLSYLTTLTSPGAASMP